jgi:hypothetical protein
LIPASVSASAVSAGCLETKFKGGRRSRRACSLFV